MERRIVKAEAKYLEDCAQMLHDSKLGSVYYKSIKTAFREVKNALKENKLYIMLQGEECVAFMIMDPRGIFNTYPYLHILAIRPDKRGQGIGTEMISWFEKCTAYKRTKCFFTVDDFNPEARRLYERLGYTCVGTLPGLYKKTADCYLMMKTVVRE